MTRRVVLGVTDTLAAPGGGSVDIYGFRTSPPGVDALTGNRLLMSFDSAWLEQMNVIAQGSAYASTTNVINDLWLLTSFSARPRPPHVWLFERGSPTTVGLFGLHVTTTTVRVRQGNPRYGYYRPTDLISYVIFESEVA